MTVSGVVFRDIQARKGSHSLMELRVIVFLCCVLRLTLANPCLSNSVFFAEMADNEVPLRPTRPNTSVVTCASSNSSTKPATCADGSNKPALKRDLGLNPEDGDSPVKHVKKQRHLAHGRYLADLKCLFFV